MESSRNFIENNFKCEICDNNFSSNMSKTQHIKNVHGELKNFTCNVCNRIFGKKETLTLHPSVILLENLSLNQDL